MNKGEAKNVSSLFKEILFDLPYYNEVAIKSELKKYTTSCLIKKIQNDPFSVLVLTESSEIIGFCFNKFDDYLIWIEWYGVKKEYRHNGLSKMLLHELERSASARQCHKLWCDCRTTNEMSKRTLISNGFLPMGTFSNHWYSLDFIIWEKLISNV